MTHPIPAATYLEGLTATSTRLETQRLTTVIGRATMRGHGVRVSRDHTGRLISARPDPTVPAGHVVDE